VADAAGGDPGVVLRARSAASLGSPREPSPRAGDVGVVRDDWTVGDPGVEAASCRSALAADFGPPGELGDGDEREPHASACEVSMHPDRGAVLLEHRGDVGVDDDVGHDGLGERRVARSAKVGEEGVELVVGLPDVVREVV
jgi:hypothetical protein